MKLCCKGGGTDQMTGSLTTSSNSASAVQQKISNNCRISNVWAGRILFLTCLAAVAAALGFTTHHVLTDAEKDLAVWQFESIADRALDTARGITLRKRLGTVSMATITSFNFPDVQDWPNVWIDGFEDIATQLIATSNGREMGFCPLVLPDQLASFESFAYTSYDSVFPDGAGTSSFGKGVYGVDPALGTSDNRYRETDGSTTYQSPNKVFAPILQHNKGVHPVLMLNVHFQESRGIIIDNMIACADRLAKEEETINCGSAITDMLYLTDLELTAGPGALIMQPIYPANNSTVLTGLIISSIVWNDVLEDVFADGVSGVDCVLETERQVYTYTVVDGIASVKGEGDLHDYSYTSYQRSSTLTGEGLFSDSSASYKLNLYPNEELFDLYSTNNPATATIGAVCIIIFTSLMFFLFDFFVRQEFREKRSVLEAKRKFVRFVSHEVRTPLNTVCMGLRLMREELGSAWVDARLQKVNSSVSSSKDELCPSTDADTSCAAIEEQKESILDLTHEILSNAESAVDVLNDLLNYDKIEMGTLSLELSIIPIWRAIEQMMSEFKLPAEAKKVNFKMDYSALIDPNTTDLEAPSAGTLPLEVQERRVVGDVVRVTQVLRNLVSNALKFTPEGGDVTIQMSWVRPRDSNRSEYQKVALSGGEEIFVAESGFLKMNVIDTGAGMTKDQTAKLFRSGVQFNVNELQAGQGSGLGLYIAKGIVEQHNGTISASSRGLERGTMFTVTLPIYHVPDRALPSSCKHLRLESNLVDGDIKTPESNDSKKTSDQPESLLILVVDDALTNRKLLTRLLERRGHLVDQSKDGLEAVEKVKLALQNDMPYDTILMDYEMPEMDGPTACREIRALGCDSFIAGITGNVLPEDISYFKRCGANTVFPKPLQLPLLESMWTEYGVTGRNCKEDCCHVISNPGKIADDDGAPLYQHSTCTHQ